MTSLRQKIQELVPIQSVLNDWCGKDVPIGQNWQTECPIHWEHRTGDINKSARIYTETNDISCFALHGRMDAVRLVQLIDGVTAREACAKIARKYDLDLRTPDYLKRYAKAVHSKQPKVRHTVLMYALTTFVKGQEGWWPTADQYLDLCEQNLNDLEAEAWPNPLTERQARDWLNDSKSRLNHLCAHLGGLANAKGSQAPW